MKKLTKAAVKRVVHAMVCLMQKSRPGRFVYAQILDAGLAMTRDVEHRGARLRFAVPNALNEFRAATFSSKEPETLEWIDGFDRGSVLWDIGANVGLYSCYAAVSKDCRVFAFEPSVFNLELLARNIFLNGLAAKVTLVPLPLTERLAVSKLNMTSTDWGGAMSTFGQEYGHDGKVMNKIFEFSTIGLSMADAADLLMVPRPDYIKMDVDGIEHLILKGGVEILRGAKSVLIEINDRFKAQADGAERYLREAGFALKEKKHSEFLETDAFRDTFNQIWTREQR
ncbi:MAG: FkbM family methyltransferase [Elusimicrobiota bacterium]